MVKCLESFPDNWWHSVRGLAMAHLGSEDEDLCNLKVFLYVDFGFAGVGPFLSTIYGNQ